MTQLPRLSDGSSARRFRVRVSERLDALRNLRDRIRRRIRHLDVTLDTARTGLPSCATMRAGNADHRERGARLLTTTEPAPTLTPRRPL